MYKSNVQRKILIVVHEPAEIISTSERLKSLSAEAAIQPWIGIDIEGNGFFRYPERVCLIQISIGQTPYLIDPLDVEDMSPLGEVLSDASVTKILHSGDYDIRSLHRDYGFQFENVFDTSIAAGFLGSKRLGLDAILKEYLDVEVTKDKKLQRSDWTDRPLSKEALAYAANDVRYLGEARQNMLDRLTEKGRSTWAEEECVRLSSVRFEQRDEETAFFHVKGSKDLDGRGLAILRSLYDFREDEAIGKDRPPFKIVSDSVLVAIAREPDGEYSEIKGIGWWGRSEKRKRLSEVVFEAKNREPVFRPRNEGRRGPHLSHREREMANQRLKDLKQWRKNLGQKLELDPSLLWPTPSLSRLARLPEGLQAEFDQAEVRRWQVKEFADSLASCLDELS